MSKPATPAPAKTDEFVSQLEKALTDEWDMIKKNDKATSLDRCRIIDRMLKLAQVKAKLQDDNWGSGFDNR